MQPSKKTQMLEMHLTVGMTSQTATAKEYPCLPLNKDINLYLVYSAADFHKASRKVIISDTFPHLLSNWPIYIAVIEEKRKQIWR